MGTSKKMVTRIAKHLRKADGHLGRTGAEAIALAAYLGVSIHTLQSIALGRRTGCDERLERAVAWIESRRG